MASPPIFQWEWVNGWKQPGQFSVFNRLFYQVGVTHRHTNQNWGAQRNQQSYRFYSKWDRASDVLWVNCCWLSTWVYPKKRHHWKSVTSMFIITFSVNMSFLGGPYTVTTVCPTFFPHPLNPSNLGAARKDRKFRLEGRPRCRSASACHCAWAGCNLQHDVRLQKGLRVRRLVVSTCFKPLIRSLNLW